MTRFDLYLVLWLLRDDRATPTLLASAAAGCFGKDASPLHQELAKQGVFAAEDCQCHLAAMEQFLHERQWNQSRVLSELRSEVEGARELEFWDQLSSRLTPRDIDDFSRRYSGAELHAEGGLGQIFKVTERSTGRTVALKRMKEAVAGSAEMAARFQAEGKITARLEHPNIVPVYDFQNVSDGGAYYTMRFLKGETLSEAVAQFHQMDDPQTRGEAQRRLLIAFVQVCNAVSYAHSVNVIHRDLKPSNVLLGEFGEVILLDWGLARVQGQSQEPSPSLSEGKALWETADLGERTCAGQVIGTPAFMAPEQAAGDHHRLGCHTDIYGLGAILYFILTGHAPHRRQEGESIPDAIRRIIDGDTPRARATNPEAPAALDAICARAMARRSGERYISPALLAADIQRWLAGDPVSAYREPLGKRLARWAIQHRRLSVAIAGVTILAALAVASAIATQWVGQQVVVANQESFLRRRIERLALAGNNWRQVAMHNMAFYRSLGNTFIDPELRGGLASVSEDTLDKLARTVAAYFLFPGRRHVHLVTADAAPQVILEVNRTAGDKAPTYRLDRANASKIQQYLLLQVEKLPQGEVVFARADPLSESTEATDTFWSAIGLWHGQRLIGCFTQELSLADALNFQLERSEASDNSQVFHYHFVTASDGQSLWTSDDAGAPILRFFLETNRDEFEEFVHDDDADKFVEFDFEGERMVALLLKSSFNYSRSPGALIFVVITDYTFMLESSKPMFYELEVAQIALLALLIGVCLWASRAIVQHAYGRE